MRGAREQDGANQQNSRVGCRLDPVEGGEDRVCRQPAQDPGLPGQQEAARAALSGMAPGQRAPLAAMASPRASHTAAAAWVNVRATVFI
jgi:hypothetical protein